MTIKSLIKFIPSPNFDARVGEGKPDMLLMHYTGMKTGEEALARLCDPTSKVASHYIIFEDGKTIQMVEEGSRAWHAGLAFWQGERDINSASIGIEIVNKGYEFGYEDFPPAQISSVIELSKDIIARHKISPERVLGHSDVAPMRKTDPGEKFPWEKLANEGIGIWPNVIKSSVQKSSPGSDIILLQERLANLGYESGERGVYCDVTIANVKAFQRHWRQHGISGLVDIETQNILEVLSRT